jgi:octaprenyl-diphosphate synthase
MKTVPSGKQENQLGGVARPPDLGVAPVSGSAAHRGEDALSNLVSLVGADLEACNRVIVAQMNSPVALIPQLAAHIVAAGGKRLRPLLTLASARLCGYPAPASSNQGGPVEGGSIQGGHARHVDLAACVEFIHTATLLHDDVVDESQLRRGLASANAVFGNKASVLVGDFLFARAFQLMVDDGSLRVLAILSKAAATIAEGEVLQLVTQNDLSTTEARYLEVVQGKTAALFSAACQIGAVVGSRPEEEEVALAEYGMKLGIAFQLVDDALDYVADQATLGKTIGDDFREGKITLPVLLAFVAGDEPERAFWQRTIETLEQTNSDLDRAMRLISDHDAIRITLDRARCFVHEAKAALLVFPDSPIRRALAGVADYTVERLR